MKRKSKKQRNVKKARNGSQANEHSVGHSDRSAFNRREFLSRARSWGIVGALAVGVGWYLIDDVTATIAEHDLSRIGNGTPAVVQIHDPQCSRCRALQRETRSALSALGDGEIQYLVANTKTNQGRDFATLHRVGNVTLLLFDGSGKRRSVVAGNRDRRSLSTIFRNHLAISAGS